LEELYRILKNSVIKASIDAISKLAEALKNVLAMQQKSCAVQNLMVTKTV